MEQPCINLFRFYFYSALSFWVHFWSWSFW